MTNQQQRTRIQPLASNEPEPLVLDKESLKDLEPAADQQGAVKAGRATIRDCIM